ERLGATSQPAGDDHEEHQRLLMRQAIAEVERVRAAAFTAIADRLVGLVVMCFQGEGTADAVQLQIVRALFALISSDRLPVRQSSMLATIRTTYNVFVLARSPGNQTIAQGTLTQMVHLVLSRVPVEPEAEDDDDDGGSDSAPQSPVAASARQDAVAPGGDGAARDAFLLLRALCKLSMRQIPNDHAADAKSPQLRSRCLALNLIRLALAEHTNAFTGSYVYLRSEVANSSGPPKPASDGHDPSTTDGDEFGDVEGPDHRFLLQQLEGASKSEPVSDKDSSVVAVPLIGVIRQYLSLSLSRNLVSSNTVVLDLGLAIFELTLQH
ncbi:guanine nucleotide exchange protein for ADP-robosylation factor, partial [Coemansia thaxteri]